MGEYAKRISDGEDVKIGTCEDLLYLRYEDRFKVSVIPGNVDPSDEKESLSLRYRLPFVDEDNVEIGEYKDPFRGLRLYKPTISACGRPDGHEDFTHPDTLTDPGIIPLRHEASGLMINAPCYHGQKLPEASEDLKPFWNGKSWSLELGQIAPRIAVDGTVRVLPIVKCRHCRGIWRMQWPEVMPFINGPIKERLAVYIPVASGEVAA